MDNFESIFDYDTVLESWSGPMDLLLYLVKKADIDIKQIFVSEVTDQFLDYVEHMDKLDLEKVCPYINVAATLVEIKSKALLPLEDDEREDLENQEQAFIEELERYKLYKEEYDLLKGAGQKMKEQEEVNSFYKAPDADVGEVKTKYLEYFTLDRLVQAFMQMMLKSDKLNREKMDLKEIPRESYTVKEKVQIIIDVLKDNEYISFFELFSKNVTRDELVTTFQAMLELLKLQQITVEQNGTFDDITLKLREDRDEIIGEIDEYN